MEIMEERDSELEIRSLLSSLKNRKERHADGVTWNLSSCTRVSETMAKNKLRGQKSRNVFHIASQKSLKG